MDHLRREDIVRALERLAREIRTTNDRAELVVGGGAALVLLYGAREATRDVDVFRWRSSEGLDLRTAALRVAEDLDLPPDWLNDGAKGFLHGFLEGSVLLEAPGLVVSTLGVPQLLAMKLAAWRDDVDIGDARLLLEKLTARNLDDAWTQVGPYVLPGRELKARYALEDLWELDRGTT